MNLDFEFVVLTFEMPWTTEQKIFIVEAYFRQKSIHAGLLQFKERIGCREFPVHSMIYMGQQVQNPWDCA